jgi:TetR/AcrR family transcriptional regulator, regulator of autoinduction and epiphytic fitness
LVPAAKPAESRSTSAGTTIRGIRPTPTRSHDDAERNGAAVDGRTRRAQRTRQGVIDAVLALIAEGDLRPTAPRIAERAGVSLRSVFQHFSDLDALFVEASDREISRISSRVETIDPSGPLDARIEAFVRQRARVLEQVTPARRAALLQEATSPAVVEVRDRLLALGREEVARTFEPELKTRKRDDRGELLDALDAATGWQMWEALRAHQGLGVDRAKAVVARIVRALLA